MKILFTKKREIWPAFLLAAAAGLLLFPASVPAQESPTPPSGASADVIESRTREEARKHFEGVSGEKTAEIEEKLPDPGPARAVSFQLNKITFEDDAPEGLPVPVSYYEDYLGKTITFRQLQEIMRRMEIYYRSKGYIALVYLVPQEIKDGEVRLGIILSRMGKLTFEGVRYSSKFRLKSYWWQKKGEPLRYDEIRQSLVRMSDYPDRSVKSILKAGEEKGTTDVIVKVDDRFPIHAGASLDNQGVKSVGKERPGFWIKHNNFLRLDDRFMIGTVFGRTFGSLYLNHLIPLTHFGTRFTWGFSHTQVTPHKEFKILGINGTAETYTLGLRQKLFESSKLLLDSYLGIDFKEKRTRQQSVTTVRDRLRVLSWGVDMQTFGENGFWSLGQNFSLGLPLVGDGHPLTSRGAESSFFKISGDIRRTQKLPLGLKGTISGGYQLSPDKLVPAEQVFLGGASSVRGYPESDYGADQSVYGSMEIQVPAYFFPKEWTVPFTESKWRDVVHGVGFVDYGYGRLRDPSSTERRSRNMLSVGGGFIIRLFKNLFARFEWGVPLGDSALTEGGNSQFHFRLQLEV